MANKMNVGKTTQMQINPKRGGSNAGAKGGAPTGYSGGKKGSKTGQGKVGQPRTANIGINKQSTLNLGSNR